MHTIIQGIYNIFYSLYHLPWYTINYHILCPYRWARNDIKHTCSLFAVAYALCSHRYKQVINTALEIVSNTLVNKQIVVSPGQAVWLTWQFTLA